MEADRFLTHSLRDRRIARILAKALAAVEPGPLVTRYLQTTRLPPYRRLFLLAIGKASESMATAAADLLGDVDSGLVITKCTAADAEAAIAAKTPQHNKRPFRVIEAGHPIPDDRSLAAGGAALRFASQVREDDLLVCLISGGGSALVTAPSEGVSLAELQMLTAALLRCGATVREINVLRRKLDLFKGGGLAAACQGSILSLVLSDVVGDEPAAIASGPTAPDPTSAEEATAILRKYSIETPSSILAALRSARHAQKPIEFERVHNVIIGNNSMAAQAARVQALLEGFDSSILGTDLQGEARQAGALLAKAMRSRLDVASRPFCLIAGGETTVTVHGPGRGGRNQELALAAVDILDSLQDVLLLTLATDGDDGPTDAAGAVVTDETCLRAAELGMRADEFLARNDAYSFFDALGDLLKPGYTGTNVNDIVLLCGL